MLPHPTTSRLPSILCSELLIAPIFLNTTLFPASTPRLPLITPPSLPLITPPRLPLITPPRLPLITPPKRQSTTLPRRTTQKLLFRATLNRNTTLMLQFTTPRPTLNRSPQVLHRRNRLLHNNVCCPCLLHRGPALLQH
jgi:hypothetical protein